MIYHRTHTCSCHLLWSSSIPTTSCFRSAPRFMCGAPLTHPSHSTGSTQTFPVFRGTVFPLPPYLLVFHILHSASVHFDFHDPLLLPRSSDCSCFLFRSHSTPSLKSTCLRTTTTLSTVWSRSGQILWTVDPKLKVWSTKTWTWTQSGPGSDPVSYRKFIYFI